jgi:hypothetical protein
MLWTFFKNHEPIFEIHEQFFEKILNNFENHEPKIKLMNNWNKSEKWTKNIFKNLYKK